MVEEPDHRIRARVCYDQIDFTIKSEEGLMKILPPDLELLGIIPNISPQALVRRQSLSETS